MNSFTLFILFVLGYTALLPLGPGLPIPPGRNPLQTGDTSLETAVSPVAGEEPVDASPRYVPVNPLPPCCPSNRYWQPVVGRHCAYTNTNLRTPTHCPAFPCFDNSTVPGHHTRANRTTHALNATTATVSTTFGFTVTLTIINSLATNNEYESTHTLCIIADGNGTDWNICVTPRHRQTKAAVPTTLATVPTIPDPNDSPPLCRTSPLATHRAQQLSRPRPD